MMSHPGISPHLSAMKFKLLVAVILALGIWFGAPRPASAQSVDSSESLQLSVRRMNAWLGTGRKAEGWRRALWIGALETQAAKGYAADPVMLGKILRQFEAGYAGLEHPNFQDVRRSLALHLQRLQTAGSSDLTALISAARGSYRPIREPEVVQAREELRAALAGLKRRYDATRTAEERQSLFETLKLAALEKELDGLKIAYLLPPAEPAPASDKPAGEKKADDQAPQPSEDTSEPAEDAAAAKAAAEAEAQAQEEQRVAARERNAERTRVLRALLGHVRDFEKASVENPDIWLMSAMIACDRFVRVLAAATSTQTESEFQSSLDVLEQDLPLLEKPEERRRAAIRVGEAIGKLTHSLQAPGLVAAVRRRFAQPNIRVEVAAGLVSSAVNRSQTDTLPVDEVILGRQIYGTANTRNQVDLEFLDDPHQITASIHLQGTIRSSNYTTQGPITAFSGSNGVFEGRQNLYANIGGFYTTDPYVAANISSFFNGVDCRLRLVQKFATKAYLKDKYAAEGISAARVETRVDRQFSEQTRTALEDARPRLAERHPQLFDLGRWIPEIALTSTRQAIHATAVKTDPIRLAAFDPVPARQFPSDIRICLHQSAISNYIDPLIAGQRFTNEELGELFEKLTSEVPEAFIANDETENWSITFPPTGAVSVEMDQQQLAIEITGLRFSQEDRQINAPLVIRIQLVIVREDGRLVLRQTSAPTVTYVDEADKNARVVGFKSFLEGKLEDGFKANQAGTPLPADLIPLDQIKEPQARDFARNLRLVELRLEQGWLSIAWNRQNANGMVSAVDLAAIRTSLPVAPAADQPAAEKTPEATLDGEASGQGPTGEKPAESQPAESQPAESQPAAPTEDVPPLLDGEGSSRTS